MIIERSSGQPELRSGRTVPYFAGRAVCLALASAMGEFGIPDELLTDIQAVHRPVRQGR